MGRDAIRVELGLSGVHGARLDYPAFRIVTTNKTPAMTNIELKYSRLQTRVQMVHCKHCGRNFGMSRYFEQPLENEHPHPLPRAEGIHSLESKIPRYPEPLLLRLCRPRARSLRSQGSRDIPH